MCSCLADDRALGVIRVEGGGGRELYRQRGPVLSAVVGAQSMRRHCQSGAVCKEDDLLRIAHMD